MKYDFKPGERVKIKNADATFYFVGQVESTVYVTVERPGYSVNAKAYTGVNWERVPKPFFEVDKKYEFKDGLCYAYEIHHVLEMGGERYAAALIPGRGGVLLDEGDFEGMKEV